MYQIQYYQNQKGEYLVQIFLDGLPDKVQAKIIKQILVLAELGPGIRRPYADFLHDGIYELRVQFSPNQYRILYFFYLKNHIIMTHGFVKNKDKVPESEINKALMYKRDFELRNKRQ